MKILKYGTAFVLVSILLGIPLCAADVVVTPERMSGPMQTGPQPESYYPQIQLFDEITFYLNGMVEFLWTVQDPAALLDGNLLLSFLDPDPKERQLRREGLHAISTLLLGRTSQS